VGISKGSAGDLIDNICEQWALLLKRNGVIQMLISKVLDGTRNWIKNEKGVNLRYSENLRCEMAKEDFNKSRYKNQLWPNEAPQRTLTNITLPNFFRDLYIGTIWVRSYDPVRRKLIMQHIPTVPNKSPPFRQNFMFEVPEASVPAVEMCWLMSEAGINTSAKETE